MGFLGKQTPQEDTSCQRSSLTKVIEKRRQQQQRHHLQLKWCPPHRINYPRTNIFRHPHPAEKKTQECIPLNAHMVSCVISDIVKNFQPTPHLRFKVKIRIRILIFWADPNALYLIAPTFLALCRPTIINNTRTIVAEIITYFALNRFRVQSKRGGIMVKTMECGIVVREFVLQSRYYVHFQANTLGKGMNPLILPATG